MNEVVIVAQSAALIVVVISYIALLRHHRLMLKASLNQERLLLDRARGAESRAAKQVNDILERISTSPRLEVREVPAIPDVDPEARRYISDLPVDDDVWNDFRGELEVED